MEKPCASKEAALRSWSPLLPEEGRGIRRLGFLKERSSQMALAPALEMNVLPHFYLYLRMV